jgi:hypothetical protein
VKPLFTCCAGCLRQARGTPAELSPSARGAAVVERDVDTPVHRPATYQLEVERLAGEVACPDDLLRVGDVTRAVRDQLVHDEVLGTDDATRNSDVPGDGLCDGIALEGRLGDEQVGAAHEHCRVVEKHDVRNGIIRIYHDGLPHGEAAAGQGVEQRGVAGRVDAHRTVEVGRGAWGSPGVPSHGADDRI